jgi:hypothetical protein
MREGPCDVLILYGGIGDAQRYRCLHLLEQLSILGVPSRAREFRDPRRNGVAPRLLVLHRVPLDSAVASTIERVRDPLLCGLRGAALYAGVAIGEVEAEEVRSLVPVDRVFVPDEANRGVYDQLYAEFPRLYRAQRGMFRRLNPG